MHYNVGYNWRTNSSNAKSIFPIANISYGIYWVQINIQVFKQFWIFLKNGVQMLIRDRRKKTANICVKYVSWILMNLSVLLNWSSFLIGISWIRNGEFAQNVFLYPILHSFQLGTRLWYFSFSTVSFVNVIISIVKSRSFYNWCNVVLVKAQIRSNFVNHFHKSVPPYRYFLHSNLFLSLFSPFP